MGESSGTTAGSREKVCVTGAGGYIASWLVKLLLARGYAVHATVRDPCKHPLPVGFSTRGRPVAGCGSISNSSRPISADPKNAHLRQLEGASENLRVSKADVLDHGALAGAVAGCRGVLHVACPVPTDKVVDPEASISTTRFSWFGFH
jgi:nucleoside-diphosphate-sugar epimerase